MTPPQPSPHASGFTPFFRFALVSDLHFGSVPDGLAAALLEDLAAMRPDLVIVAGDLTMRARAAEFQAAGEWLRALPAPHLLLPGNHDLPYFNLLERFASPFRRYVRATGGGLLPRFETEAAVIVGVNTARSWQPHPMWQEGAIKPALARRAAERIAAATPQAFRAVVTHHPLLLPRGLRRAWRQTIGAAGAVETLAAAGAELFMSGHVHLSYAERFERGGRAVLSVGAPTALSWRKRGEENGYWLADVGAAAIRLSLRRIAGAGFAQASSSLWPRLRAEGDVISLPQP